MKISHAELAALLDPTCAMVAGAQSSQPAGAGPPLETEPAASASAARAGLDWPFRKGTPRSVPSRGRWGFQTCASGYAGSQIPRQRGKSALPDVQLAVCAKHKREKQVSGEMSVAA
jgi:hypothetical protein